MSLRTPLMTVSVVADEPERAEAVTVAARAGGAVWMAWEAMAVVNAEAGIVAPLALGMGRGFSMARKTRWLAASLEIPSAAPTSRMERSSKKRRAMAWR